MNEKPNKRHDTTKRRKAPDSSAVRRPTHVANRRGIVVKEKIPSAANFKSFINGYLVSPAARASRSYVMPVWRNSAQARKPRTKMFRSRMFTITSTTARSIKQKSPESSGIFVSEKNHNTR